MLVGDGLPSRIGVQVQRGPDARQRETGPNPVFCAMPTHPDHTSAAAETARTSSGQDRTVRPGRAPATVRSAATGPLVLAGTGPRRPACMAEDTATAKA